MRRTSGKFTCHQRINRQDQATLIGGGGRHDAARCFHHIRLDKRGPNIMPLGQQKGVGHAAAQHNAVNTCDKIFKYLQLG